MELLFVICIIMLAANVVLFVENKCKDSEIIVLQANNIMLMDRTEDLHYRVGVLEMKEVNDTAEFDSVYDDEDYAVDEDYCIDDEGIDEDECENGVCNIKF